MSEIDVGGKKKLTEKEFTQLLSTIAEIRGLNTVPVDYAPVPKKVKWSKDLINYEESYMLSKEELLEYGKKKSLRKKVDFPACYKDGFEAAIDLLYPAIEALEKNGKQCKHAGLGADVLNCECSSCLANKAISDIKAKLEGE